MFHIFLSSQNKTAAALHLGSGDCCEEKHSNAAELLLKEGELWGVGGCLQKTMQQ